MAAQNSTKAARKVPGKPFQKGQSGNPGGRTALPEAFKKSGPAALEKLVKLMDSQDDNISLKAAQSVADRVYGKAVQAVDANMTGDISIVTTLERAIARARAAND